MSEQTASESSEVNSQVPGRRPLSRGRRWAFRAISLLLVPALMACLEAALRFGGFGTAPELVVPVKDSPATLNHLLNPSVEFPYYPATDLSGPEPRRFQLPKPEGVYRIVFLGGSTVIGFPYTPEVAFPRQVELILESQSPQLNVEALNAGVTAMNSFMVADLTEQCLQSEPDLIVIHTGHNEFYGPGGPASSATRVSPDLFVPMIGIRRTRLGQAVLRMTTPAPEDQQDPLEVLPRLTEIPLESEVVLQAAANVRANLERAVNSARRRGIPVIVSTVGCNLRDQGPLRSVWPAGIGDEDLKLCEQLLRDAEDRLGQADAATALPLLLEAEDICGTYARLQYRKGQALEGNGRYPEAEIAFRLARDYDGCRLRAPQSFRTICEDVVGQFDDDSVYLLDIAEKVDEASAPHAPGHNLFLEHVHYNLDGHRLLAQLFARLIQTEILEDDWDESQRLSPEQLDRALGVIPEDDLAACSLALEVIETSPMREAVDAGAQSEHLLRQIQDVYSELPQERQEGFANLAISEMGGDLCAALVRSHAGAGAQDVSLTLAELGIKRRPWSPQGWFPAGSGSTACRPDGGCSSQPGNRNGTATRLAGGGAASRGFES